MVSVLPKLEKDLFKTFRSKRKFAEKDYVIFLTNQFYKDQFIEFVRGNFSSVECIVTSGTIKKCKSVMQKHIVSQTLREKEISTLL